MAVRREASATSALEGTYAPFDQVLASDFVDASAQSSEQREIANAVRATSHGIEAVVTRPIARRLIGELQLMLVSGTRDEEYDSGDLRQRQVMIGSRGSRVQDARFIPVPEGDLLVQGFSDWERWINDPEAAPTIIRVALGHYQFETLHPYNNGNGRVGRIVALLQIIEAGILQHPVLDLSVALNSSKDMYITNLLRTSQTGDFSTWTTYFSNAVAPPASGRSRGWLMPVLTCAASTSRTHTVVLSLPVPVVVGTATSGSSGCVGRLRPADRRR